MEFHTKKWRGAAGLILLAFVLYCAAQNLDKIGTGLGMLLGFSQPILLGGCIAFVLNIPMSAIEKYLHHARWRWMKRWSRPLSLVGAAVFISAVLGLVVALVVPELTNTIQLLASEIPKFWTWFQKWLLENEEMYPALKEWIAGLSINWEQVGREVFQALTSGVSGVLGGTVAVISGVFSGVINTVVAFIISIYVLLDKERLSRQFCRILHAFFTPRLESYLLHVGSVAHRAFSNFIVGQCTEAVILGCLCAGGMALLRMPYAPMVGAMVGVTALIPVVGAFIGASVGVFMIMMKSPLQAVGFIVFLIILQQIEGNLIYPRVVGSSVGLPALWVLVAVTIGGGISGVGGMLFSVPIASVLYSLLREYTNQRNACKATECSAQCESIEKTQ